MKISPYLLLIPLMTSLYSCSVGIRALDFNDREEKIIELYSYNNNLPVLSVMGNIPNFSPCLLEDNKENEETSYDGLIRDRKLDDFGQDVILFEPILFDPSSSLPAGKEREKLISIVNYLSSLSLEEINIVGYTDYSGNSAANKILSLNRAKQITDIIKESLPPIVIKTEGLGVYQNTTDPTFQRRVDIFVSLKK